VAELEAGLRRLGCELYLPESLEHRSGILSLGWPGVDPVAVRKRCLSQGIVTSVRAGRLRVSTHAYNNSDDIQRLVDTLKDCMRG
jgi:selenocysteine lyase/cysteine desulfurase